METLARWHELVRTGDLNGLDDLLHDDVVFRSPVLFTPVEGKALTAMYLAGAYQVLVEGGSFTYVREVVDPPHAVLEFTTEIDGIQVNGVDMITWDDDGRIVDFTVMVRPKKAFDLVHAKMAALVEQ
ncbi:MAG: nuclear transport factor 2 family protein [Nitriliruptorales bacterium]|nr:nuclear transport factor 2 family protein [Nitriliruptorales bacterium]